MAVYTTIDDPEAYFQVQLYTGDGGTDRAITLGGDTDMQPDLVWIKNRDGTNNHILQDAVRGATKSLESDGTGSEVTSSTRVLSFGSDGFSIGSAGTNNTNTNKYVAWNWKAGGSGSSNTTGTINTTKTSANTTSGVSIVTYTGSGSAGTLGHGLGIVPKMFVVKRLDSTSAWSMYWKVLGANKYIYLNSTSVAATDSTSEFWNNTDPTSTVFSVKDANYTNGSSQTYVAYLFAPVKGYSKFGSYTGNGNVDGPFIYTGFRPSLLIIKSTTVAGQNWEMWDNKRTLFNNGGNLLSANTSAAQRSNSTWTSMDFLSNGFKIRYSDALNNQSPDTYIYMAFAEAPFVNSNGVPCNAR